MAFSGGCTPVLAKHTKHLSLVDILSFGLERMQRNFEPMRQISIVSKVSRKKASSRLNYWTMRVAGTIVLVPTWPR